MTNIIVAFHLPSHLKTHGIYPLMYTNAFTYRSFHLLCCVTKVSFAISEGFSDVDTKISCFLLVRYSITKLSSSLGMEKSVVCVMKSSVCFDVTPCSLVGKYQSFGGSHCQNFAFIKMEAVAPSKDRLLTTGLYVVTFRRTVTFNTLAY
jgi:hypothetical protein